MRWPDDPGATYRPWLLWEERVKIFRSIRRGLQAVVRDQLRRSAFSHVAALRVRYPPYRKLERDRETMARFGHGMEGPSR